MKPNLVTIIRISFLLINISYFWYISYKISTLCVVINKTNRLDMMNICQRLSSLCHITYLFYHFYTFPLPTMALQDLEVDRQLLLLFFDHLNLDLCLVPPVWDSYSKIFNRQKLRYEWCYWKRMATLKKKKKNYFTESFCDRKEAYLRTSYCCFLSLN